MKKIISIVLALCLMVSVMPFAMPQVVAATAKSGKTGECTWELDGTVLTIGGNGNMAENYYNGLPWGDDITEVYIKDGVTSIGDSAFQTCYKLKYAYIAGSVKKIGKGAFASCGHLTDIELCEGITSIGDHAFSYCMGLTTITLPNSMKSIGEEAFYACVNLATIEFPDCIENINYGAFGATAFYSDEDNWENGKLYMGPYLIKALSDCADFSFKEGTRVIAGMAFSNCENLISVKIPDSVVGICDYSFWNCTNLTTVEIPEGVKTIGGGAFNGCQKLNGINVPDSVTSIGPSAFLSTAYYNDKNNWTDGVLYMNNNLVGVSLEITDCKIIEGTKLIAPGSFRYCSNLTTIELPESITSISDWTFYDSRHIQTFILPKSVTDIGRYAFDSCRIKEIWYGGTRAEAALIKPNIGSEDTIWYYEGEKVITTYEDVFVSTSEGIEKVTVEDGKIDIKVLGEEINLDIKDEDGKSLEIYADPSRSVSIDGKVNMSEQLIKVYAVNEYGAVYEVSLSKDATEYDFADLNVDAWYIPYVETATKLGIIRGQVVDGKDVLKPEDKATRIEGIVFALRMLGVETTQFSDVEIDFIDYDENSAVNKWSINYVKAAVALGLMKGSSDINGNLHLNGQDSISRQEFFAIFARAMQIFDLNEQYKTENLYYFDDYDKIEPWFFDNIKYLVYNKIVDGIVMDGEKFINPQGDILRCEIIKMVTAALS
ncbi:MAG: leucine-rich repeat protein [Clostridia bacterium]|nr:leucine-rich repeat protein [Clostridia bacterium]